MYFIYSVRVKNLWILLIYNSKIRTLERLKLIVLPQTICIFRSIKTAGYIMKQLEASASKQEHINSFTEILGNV